MTDLKSKLVVLYIEDNYGDFILLKDALHQNIKQEFELLYAKNLADGIELLKNNEVDIVLLDLNLPDSYGTDTFTTFNKVQTDIPIIIMTGLENETSAHELVRKGAQDYIIKGQSSATLIIRSINYAIERKRNELLLREKEEQMRTIIDKNTDAMIIVDNAGFILFANPVAEKFFGKNDSELIHCQFGIPLSNDETTQLSLLSHKGQRVTFNMRQSEIEWKGISAKLIVLRDITQLIEIQKKYKLEKEKAELANRQKSEFLANVAHDFRSPLNVIYGFSSVLSDPDVDEEEKNDSIKFIHESSKNLMNLVNDLVDNAKIEAGQIDIKPRPIRLKDFCEQIFNHYQKATHNEDIKFRLDIPSDSRTVMLDSTRVRQVIVNLMDNAVKFTNKGFIDFGYEIKTNHKILFYVKDTGRGIHENHQKDIFNRYTREVKKKEKIKGSGLGLSIVKQLVELMGGEIWLESKVEDLASGETGGSTFYFTVSFENDADIEEKKEEQFDLPNLSNKSLLIVEDEEMNYHYINGLLAKTHCITHWSKNGKEALEYLEEKNHIDLILLDLKMPVMDGYQTAEEIRKRRINIPIIVQTAFVMDNEEVKCKKLGCNDFIAKPIIAEKLYQKIAQNI